MTWHDALGFDTSPNGCLPHETQKNPDSGMFINCYIRAECESRWFFHCRMIVIAFDHSRITDTNIGAFIVIGEPRQAMGYFTDSLVTDNTDTNNVLEGRLIRP